MKTITLLLVILLCTTFGFAQQRKIEKSVTATAFGSFGSVKSTDQTQVKDKVSSELASNVVVKRTTTKMICGGTATLVKFNSKTTKHPFMAETKKTIAEDYLKMTVYPNPARSEINITLTACLPDRQVGGKQLAGEGKYILRIKNIMGQSIYEQQFSEKQLKVDSSGFPRGFFLVEVSTIDGNASHTEKVIIQ